MEIFNGFEDFFTFISRIGIVLFVTVSLYEGTALLVTAEQDKKKAIRMVLGGSLACIAMGTLLLWNSQMSKNVASTTFLTEPLKSQIQNLPDNWGSTLPPEKREKSSRILASIAFTGTGKLVQYFDHNGVRKPYCPTEQDIGLRDKAVEAKVQLETIYGDGRRAALWWFGLGILSVLGGWIKGREEKKKSAN